MDNDGYYYWSELVDKPINLLVSYYMMSSYLYYELDKNVFTDDEFNMLCKRLLAEYDDITHHHKHLVSKDNLSASTGYDIVYPQIVKNASASWYDMSLRKRDYLR